MADACRAPGLIQRYREELQVRHYASDWREIQPWWWGCCMEVGSG